MPEMAPDNEQPLEEQGVSSETGSVEMAAEAEEDENNDRYLFYLFCSRFVVHFGVMKPAWARATAPSLVLSSIPVAYEKNCYFHFILSRLFSHLYFSWQIYKKTVIKSFSSHSTSSSDADYAKITNPDVTSGSEEEEYDHEEPDLDVDDVTLLSSVLAQ